MVVVPPTNINHDLFHIKEKSSNSSGHGQKKSKKYGHDGKM